MPFLTEPTESECFEAAQKELEELRAQNDKAIFLTMLEANIKYRKWEDQNGIQNNNGNKWK